MQTQPQVPPLNPAELDEDEGWLCPACDRKVGSISCVDKGAGAALKTRSGLCWLCPTYSCKVDRTELAPDQIWSMSHAQPQQLLPSDCSWRRTSAAVLPAFQMLCCTPCAKILCCAACVQLLFRWT